MFDKSMFSLNFVLKGIVLPKIVAIVIFIPM